MNATGLISELDQTLSIVRRFWLNAADDREEREKWQEKINRLLDQRSRLMRLGDRML